MALERIGLVVHPTRDVAEPFRALQTWSRAHDVEVVQVHAPCEQQQVAPRGEVSECDVVVSIGGDGTTLSALRAAAAVDRPALGIACGSLGVLTSVPAELAAEALERFSLGDWIPRELPALRIERDTGDPLLALNDLALVRSGDGQVFARAEVDGVLFARLAGDGCIVSTPIGSSAYSFAAGGPLMMLELEAFLLTPLSVHGGSFRPLVIGADSELRLEITTRQSRSRLEVDGQLADRDVAALTITLTAAMARAVAFTDQEPFLSGLRQRQIIADSPRILADETRS